MSGIEKEVDSPGRVVLPIKYRSKLNISKKSKVVITLEGGFIKISPKQLLCALCGTDENVNPRLRLCADCIKRIRNENFEQHRYKKALPYARCHRGNTQ